MSGVSSQLSKKETTDTFLGRRLSLVLVSRCLAAVVGWLLEEAAQVVFEDTSPISNFIL